MIIFVLFQEINDGTNQSELKTIAEYYFDGQGKALRPMVSMLMGRAINYHLNRENRFVISFLYIMRYIETNIAVALGLGGFYVIWDVFSSGFKILPS